MSQYTYKVCVPFINRETGMLSEQKVKVVVLFGLNQKYAFCQNGWKKELFLELITGTSKGKRENYFNTKN